MQFIFNEFPASPDFAPEGNEEWTPLKESTDLWTVQLQALPFVILNVGGVVLLMYYLAGIRFEFNIFDVLWSFLIFMPVHELLHAFFFPASLKSDEVYLGFTFKGFAPFAAYTGEMARNDFLKSLLAPLVIITVVGMVWLMMFGHNSLVEHIILFNALGACADCLGVLLVTWQVPRNAVVRNKGIRTYWRVASY